MSTRDDAEQVARWIVEVRNGEAVPVGQILSCALVTPGGRQYVEVPGGPAGLAVLRAGVTAGLLEREERPLYVRGTGHPRSRKRRDGSRSFDSWYKPGPEARRLYE